MTRKTEFVLTLLSVTVGFVTILALAGCDKPMSNVDFIADSATCKDNGYESRTIRSGWDGEITGVECYTPRVFEPRQTEFVLADGTRCVMFSTPAPTSARAGSSGVSCNWKNKD